jgi:hypothetical protein
MNSFTYNLLIGLLAIIILICAFSKNTLYYGKESFEMPKIVKNTYRPIERNIRRRIEGFYDKSSINISNLFRKFGII